MPRDADRRGQGAARDAAPADGELPPHDGGQDARPRSDRQSRPEPGEDPAAGTIDHPVSPGEPQAGDLSEAAANLGGPVDVFPLRDRARKERPPG